MFYKDNIQGYYSRKRKETKRFSNTIKLQLLRDIIGEMFTLANFVPLNNFLEITTLLLYKSKKYNIDSNIDFNIDFNINPRSDSKFDSEGT